MVTFSKRSLEKKVISFNRHRVWQAWLEEAPRRVSLAQEQVQWGSPRGCRSHPPAPKKAFFRLPWCIPLLQGQKLGFVWSVFPEPWHLQPAQFLLRRGGWEEQKDQMGTTWGGSGGWSCKPNVIQALEKSLKRTWWKCGWKKSQPCSPQEDSTAENTDIQVLMETPSHWEGCSFQADSPPGLKFVCAAPTFSCTPLEWYPCPRAPQAAHKQFNSI